MTTTHALHPRPHQVSALTDLTRALAVHNRAQLVMACGTGKTLVGRWHAQACGAELVVVLVSSLALVAQTLRGWRRASRADGWRFSALVVCSDPSTAAGAAERALDSDDPTTVDTDTWDSVHARVTTNPIVATRFLRQHKPGHIQVVFSTYHSAPVVAAAQAASGAVFDLEVCDEAHNLAGRPRDAFRVALDPRGIVARKRIFMTASPLAFDGDDNLSMDDPTLFGPVAHTVTFDEAIAAGLLTDYQVLVVAARENQADVEQDQSTLVPAALMDAIDTHGVRRVLSFHSRVAKAARFAETITGAVTPGGRRILARHVHSGIPTAQRVRTLQWLAHTPENDPSTVRVVSNARCLSEGVDVPAVDGILFADKRSSVVNIIQAVGRVLRPAPGKTRGTIILPVVLPADGDDDSALATTAFAHVWAVLRGLRAHDQRLAAEVDRAIREVTRRARRGRNRPGRIEFVLPDDMDRDAVQLRFVQEVGSIWERNYALLEDWAHTNTGRILPRNAKVRGVNLGEWGEQQRIAHHNGLLPANRAHRLEQVHGWTWDKAEARWDLTYEVLHAFADEHGTVADDPTIPSIFDGMKDRETPRRALGVWQAVQRQAYRLGTLSDRKIGLLEELPGWAWDAHLPGDDVAMVEALRVFTEFEKHGRVPDDHIEDGLRLGAWCWAVRRRKLTGRLAPALEHEILAATPSKFRPSQRFQWEKAETQWRLGYFALRQFVARERHAHVTGNHQEQLPDATVNLGQWVAMQRYQHRRGELDDRRVPLLEALPGWQWEINLQTVTASEPVDLPDGLAHGRAGAYENHKCRCAECLEWRRAGDRERLAAGRAPKHPASAGRARQHLQKLETAGAKRTTLATVSGVPLGVVKKVLADEVEQIEREHQLRLLAVTPSMVDQAQTRVGSRGRPTTTHNERIDSAATWTLLDDLTGRGFGITWVSRELGYTGGLQLRRGTSISRRLADQVHDLHQRAGDLTMQPLPKTARRPSLAELQRQRAA